MIRLASPPVPTIAPADPRQKGARTRGGFRSPPGSGGRGERATGAWRRDVRVAFFVLDCPDVVTLDLTA